MSQMEGPLGESRLQEKDLASHSNQGSFVVSHSHAQFCLKSIDLWVFDALERMNEASRVLIAQIFAKVLVKLDDEICKIVAERD